MSGGERNSKYKCGTRVRIKHPDHGIFAFGTITDILPVSDSDNSIHQVKVDFDYKMLKTSEWIYFSNVIVKDLEQIIFQVCDEEVSVGCSILVQHKLKSCPIAGKQWYHAIVYKKYGTGEPDRKQKRLKVQLNLGKRGLMNADIPDKGQFEYHADCDKKAYKLYRMKMPVVKNALYCEKCNPDEKCDSCGCHHCHEKTNHEMVVCSECGLFICTKCWCKFTRNPLFEIDCFNDIVYCPTCDDKLSKLLEEGGREDLAYKNRRFVTEASFDAAYPKDYRRKHFLKLDPSNFLRLSKPPPKQPVESAKVETSHQQSQVRQQEESKQQTPVTKQRKLIKPVSAEQRRNGSLEKRASVGHKKVSPGSDDDFSPPTKRIKNKVTPKKKLENETESFKFKEFMVPKHHVGKIPGVPVGMTFSLRRHVGNVNLHGPLVQGIAGNGEKAYSIVMSAGYEGDTDEGDRLFYSASGGRNLDSSKRTGAQVEDQSLLKGSSANRGFANTCYAPLDLEKGADAGDDWKMSKPIRVLRSCKAKKVGNFAPEAGVRYDGLYKVKKYQQEKSKDSNGNDLVVWRFELLRDDKEPAPWTPEGRKLTEMFALDCPDLHVNEVEWNFYPTETKKIANERKKNIKKFYVPKDWRFIMAKDEVNRKRYDLIEKYSSEHNGLREWYIGLQKYLSCDECKIVVKYKSGIINLDCGCIFCKPCLENKNGKLKKQAITKFKTFTIDKYPRCPVCGIKFEQDALRKVNERLCKLLHLIFNYNYEHCLDDGRDDVLSISKPEDELYTGWQNLDKQGQLIDQYIYL